MSADDRLRVIARHIGAARNNVYPSLVRHLCSSESQSSESVQGGVALPSTGPASDARKPRKSKQVHSVIPKNRYECLVCICFGLNRILLCLLIGLNDRGTVVQFLSRERDCSLVQRIQNGYGVRSASRVVGTGDYSYSLRRWGSLTYTAYSHQDRPHLLQRSRMHRPIFPLPHMLSLCGQMIVFLYRFS